MESLETNITIEGKEYILDAPPLEFGALTNVSEHRATYSTLGGQTWTSDIWPLSNESLRSYTSIIESSECIPTKQYSCGFSSQLLLTFCVYTFPFATTLVALHTEAYWESRSYRLNQPHSIYSDILAIADALESKFGSDVRSLPIKDLDKKISRHAGGIRLQVDGLPPRRGEVFRHKELRQALQAGNEDAGEEVATMSGALDDEASGSQAVATGVELSHLPPTNSQLRPRSEYIDLEGRAPSPLLGLEDEILRIHSRYSSSEHGTLLPAGHISESRNT